MAECFVDHGAYASALGTSPTWGVPQEGDGSSINAASAASIASVVFASVPSSGVLSICGVSPSMTGVVGAASVDAAANALASNINATTTTVGATVAAGTPQLRNLVYARGPSGGAPAGTCQIMMRVGSATLNHANNANVAIAQTLSPSATLNQFAGGSGGCWGHFINTAALGVGGSIPKYSYGAWLFLPYSPTVPGATDTVWVRSGGGASKTLLIQTASYENLSLVHAAFANNIVVDTNTKWVGDSPSGTLKIQLETLYSGGITITPTAPNKPCSLSALRRGGIEFERTAASSNSLGSSGCRFTSCTAACSWALRNAVVRESGPVGTAPSTLTLQMHFTAAGTGHAAFTDCDYVVTLPRSTLGTTQFTWPASFGPANGRMTFTGCTFDYNINGAGYPGDLLGINASHIYDAIVEFRNCRFLGYSVGYKLLTDPKSYPATNVRATLIADNCSGLAMPASYIGFPSATAFVDQSIHLNIHANAADVVAPGMRVEDSRGVCEWVPADNPPTLSATTPAGAAWSWKLLWFQSVGLTPGYRYTAPILRMFSQLAAAVRTLTLEGFFPNAVGSGIEVSFGYTDNTGTPRHQAVTAHAASAATWANVGSYGAHSARKFSVVTDYPVAANSEVTCQVSLTGSPPSPVTALYFDPELKVE